MSGPVRPEPRTLVLWDVDRTLIDAGACGRAFYAAAFERFAGRPMRVRVEAAGRTDPDILRDALAAHGIEPGPGSFERFSDLLAAVYAEGARLLGREGRALPGAPEALDALAGLPGVVQSVLTGNIRRVAAIKLGAFGLHAHLDLDVGAYGSDHAVRAELVGVARARVAAAYGSALPGPATVLVGDTPHDVAAGRGAGAFVVAVASGASTQADLAAAGAEIVLPDLTDTAALLRAVTAGPGTTGG